MLLTTHHLPFSPLGGLKALLSAEEMPRYSTSRRQDHPLLPVPWTLVASAGFLEQEHPRGFKGCIALLTGEQGCALTVTISSEAGST